MSEPTGRTGDAVPLLRLERVLAADLAAEV
jgi:hypothetical protein